MPLFSANLGFLWTELQVPDAIRAAKAAGFDAVELHWPDDTEIEDIRRALVETGLPLISLNTQRGDVSAGENGLSALPGRETEARAAIDRALRNADALNTRAVHVMAGTASGAQAHATFCENLRYACTHAAARGIDIVIEPLNSYDAPGYFMSHTETAKAIIADVAHPNLKLMFDAYHVARMEGDICGRLETLLPIIGHIQFADSPTRGAPGSGETDFRQFFETVSRLGYEAPLGAEYKPASKTDDSLDWLARYR